MNSLRNKILSLLAAGAMVLSLAACGNSQVNSEPSGTPEPAETVSGETAGTTVKELKIGTCRETTPRSIAREGGSFGKMNYNGFCTGNYLLRDENNEIQPFMMTGWEILEDGHVIRATFATDRGITWHDGVPVTMDDVLFSLNGLNRDPKIGSFTKIEHAEKVNDTTADLYLNDNASYFTLGGAAVFERIYPKHIWENIENATEYTGEDAAIGCGPYKLVSVDEEAQTLHFEAVDNWPMGELTVETVSVKSYGSQDALIMALSTGEIDAVYDYSTPISPTMLPSITGKDGIDPGKGMNMGLYEILFGFNKNPTDDLAFRKAVRSALDYKLLAATIGGEDGQIPHEGIIAPVSTGYDDSLPELRQDQEQAKAILEEAGYKDIDGDGYREKPDGSKMDVLVTPQYNKSRAAVYQRIAEIIMKNLDEVGVKTTLDEESVRNADHEKQVKQEGSYEIYICYSTQGVGFYKTPLFYHFNDPISAWGTCTLENFDTAYRKMLNAQGPEDYEASVKELQHIVSEEAIGIALCWDTAYFPYRTDKYEGWTNFPGWGVINYKTWSSLHPIA